MHCPSSSGLVPAIVGLTFRAQGHQSAAFEAMKSISGRFFQVSGNRVRRLLSRRDGEKRRQQRGQGNVSGNTSRTRTRRARNAEHKRQQRSLEAQVRLSGSKLRRQSRRTRTWTTSIRSWPSRGGRRRGLFITTSRKPGSPSSREFFARAGPGPGDLHVRDRRELRRAPSL